MTVIASLEAVALVAIVYLLLRHHAAQTAAWALERRELLNRIQRPEQLPHLDRPAFEYSEDDQPDELALVGTIQEPVEEG